MYEMKPMAESLASQGRYGDSMLVHMNPVEVAGLRAAAQRMGGDLTTNPQTGQPEAFLPFLLGMGLQGLGMSALGAGIATGLGTAAITKDLGQGLLAGLGAYGGAGIGEGLGAAGTATQAAQPTTSSALMESLNTAAPTNTLSAGTQGFGSATLPSGATVSDQLVSMGPSADTMTGIGGLQNMPQQPFSTGLERIGTQGFGGASLSPDSFAAVSPTQLTTGVGEQSFLAGNLPIQPEPSITKGIQGVLSGGTEGTAAREAFMKGVGGEKGLLGYTAAGIAPYAFEQPGVAGYEGQRSLIRPFDYDPTTREFTERTPYAAPGPEYMARGGMVQRMAQGGLTGYKEGNILRGQGDGMSDEIEASIGGEQDVLLSDGEYVVPADAVAMLGNGSTDAGANRLDEMIARLRMKKYGRDKQPPEMKAESVMPT